LQLTRTSYTEIEKIAKEAEMVKVEIIVKVSVFSQEAVVYKIVHFLPRLPILAALPLPPALPPPNPLPFKASFIAKSKTSSTPCPVIALTSAYLAPIRFATA
jgi:hypothetical protein